MSNIREALHGAHCVVVSDTGELAVVWHGGSTFNVYSTSTWTAVDCFTRYASGSTDGSYPSRYEAQMCAEDYLGRNAHE